VCNPQHSGFDSPLARNARGAPVTNLRRDRAQLADPSRHLGIVGERHRLPDAAVDDESPVFCRIFGT